MAFTSEIDGIALVHIIWLWMKRKYIDYRTAMQLNNRWSNFASVSMENHQIENNKRVLAAIEECIGIKDQKWQAQIRVNNKLFSLGYFDDPKDASKAYLAAKAKYHTFNPIPREEACGCHTTLEVSM